MSTPPPTDPRRAAGKTNRQVASDTLRHEAGAAKLLFKLITLPFWMPFSLARGLKERREIRAFIIEQAPGQPITNALIKDLTIGWAERNPQRYPHGRYDRKFDRLKVRFESAARILQQRRGY